jgi:hypothetical protein
MLSSSRDEIVGVFDDLKAVMGRALQLSFDALTSRECLALLERCETLRRQLPAVEHPLVNEVAAADPGQLDGKPARALADRLRISRGEAGRRIATAAELTPRRSLTGQPLEPVLAGTAAAQRDGQLNGEHVRIIRSFWHHLPEKIDIDERTDAEAQLAEFGTQFRPDQLAKLAAKKFDFLVPDGLFSDTERAKRRTLMLGRQDRDGMSPVTGWVNPEGRATLDAALARWAGPGMCNPDDDTPLIVKRSVQHRLEDAERRGDLAGRGSAPARVAVREGP